MIPFFYQRDGCLKSLLSNFINFIIFIILGIRDVKLEYKTLKEKMKEFNKQEAKFYGNMFAKMSKLGSESNVSLNIRQNG